MVKKSTLRWLVALEIALVLIPAFVAISEPSSDLQQPGGEEASFVFFQGGEELSQKMVWPLGIAIIIAGITAYVGLLRFKLWGRRWYVIYTALNLALLPFVKPGLEKGWEFLAGGVSQIITGAILALLFFTPLKEYFGKKKTDVPTPNDSGTSEVREN
jgi:hypothetical protein